MSGPTNGGQIVSLLFTCNPWRTIRDHQTPRLKSNRRPQATGFGGLCGLVGES